MIYRIVIIVIIFNGFIFTAHGVDKPDPVPSKLTEIRARGWYEEKVRSWKTYLNENSGNASDWLEYFRTAQYARLSQAELREIATEMTIKFNNTFEANYVQAQAEGWSDHGVRLLQQSLQQTTELTKIFPDRLMLAEVTLDYVQRQKLSKELFDTHTLYPSLLNYAYNVLMSVGEDGVLIVQGASVTIPLWLLQDVMQVRPDISILNLDLAENTNYLMNWMTEHKLKGTSLVGTIEPHEVIRKLPDLNTALNFYYGLTLPEERVHSLEDKLYVVGLASLHRKESFDHYSVLKENIEKKFLLDYLTVDFSGEPKTATGRVYETNYILPFLLIKEYYDKQGDTQSSDHWREIILNLADRSQIRNRVFFLLKNQETSLEKPFSKISLEVKDLDKKMVNVKDNLYASTYELTNEEYWFYLDYLYKNGYKELYDQSIVDRSKYDPVTAALFSNYHYSPVNFEAAQAPKTKMKAYWKYPAMDMSYEAAKGYCEWLTFQYNQQEGRKYKRVRFRLPTQQEWTMAALGYKEFSSWILKENTVMAYNDWKKDKKDLKPYNLNEYSVLYPWWYPNFNYRDKILNSKDCYLSNIKTPETITCPSGAKGDGFTVTSFVGAYFANLMGLYDAVGNVAEMIDEDGKAMGGSWNHPPEESTIVSVNEYDGSDPAVGFRLFMEVIEE